MFDYDKTEKKLRKFDELSKKKQRKLLCTIFKNEVVDGNFRGWFYNTDRDAPPMTGPMVTRIFNTLAEPAVLRRVIKFLESESGLDRTSHCLAFLLANHAIDIVNKGASEVSDKFTSGEVDAKAAKSYKNKGEKYTEMIAELMNALKEAARDNVKNIARKSNLPKNFVYATYFLVPEERYVQKSAIGGLAGNLLNEIYKVTAMTGVEDIPSIKWEEYFAEMFGKDRTASVAISIIMEGVTRIDAYREYDHFTDVTIIWDSLTKYALECLDAAPDNLRGQLLDIYIKRVSAINSKNNGPVRMRVDLLAIPEKFSNLIYSTNKLSNQLRDLKDGRVVVTPSTEDNYGRDQRGGGGFNQNRQQGQFDRGRDGRQQGQFDRGPRDQGRYNNNRGGGFQRDDRPRQNNDNRFNNRDDRGPRDNRNNDNRFNNRDERRGKRPNDTFGTFEKRTPEELEEKVELETLNIPGLEDDNEDDD